MIRSSRRILLLERDLDVAMWAGITLSCVQSCTRSCTSGNADYSDSGPRPLISEALSLQ